MRKSTPCLFPLLLAFMVLFAASVAAQEQDAGLAVNAGSGAAYREGLALFNKNNHAGAIEAFAKAYTLDERNTAALFAKGLSLTKLGKNADAVQVFEQVVAKDPTHEKAWRMLPSALETTGNTDRAIAAYDRGLKNLPGNYNLLFGKATLLLKLEKTTEAIPLLQKALSVNSGSTEVLEKLAYAYRESGDLNKAHEMARSILAKDPNHARAQTLVGDYHRVRNEFSAAIAAYTIAAKNIETKAYAEHYLEVIQQLKEEQEIEREFEEHIKNTSQGREKQK